MKNKYLFLLILFVIILGILTFCIFLQNQRIFQQKYSFKQVKTEKIKQDIPLFPILEWSEPKSETVSYYFGNGEKKLSGTVYEAYLPDKNNAKISVELLSFYKKELTSRGYDYDTSLDPGGPVTESISYVKDLKHFIITSGQCGHIDGWTDEDYSNMCPISYTLFIEK